MSSPATQPVIVGIGEWLDRPADPRDGLEPVDLMLRAARVAEDDARAPLLQQVDSLDVVNLSSWRYRDAPGLLAECLGIDPSHRAYGAVGGESPLRLIQDAAERIIDGQSRVALICGAESQSTVGKAAAQGITLPWTHWAEDGPAPLRGHTLVHPLAAVLGCDRPATVYPFYETASTAHWGQTPSAAQRESGELWSRYARHAAGNPCAWLREPYSPADVTTPSEQNRWIAWPYTKRMTANPQVNQGAAVLVTSLALARRAGLPEERLVHIWGGVQANEPGDFLARDHYWESHAQSTVLESARHLAGGVFEAMELYSCFPCVPKMARRALGLPARFEPTVTGGLTFFGAPLNNYMTHATCAMVRRLRASRSFFPGLLYGQGEFVTKHHALLLARRPYPGHPDLAFSSVQSIADSRRGEVPPLEISPAGEGQLEAFTVIHRRDGSVAHGVAILRTPSGTRTLAEVAADDAWTLAVLTRSEVAPIGRCGLLQPTSRGHSRWSLPR